MNQIFWKIEDQIPLHVESEIVDFFNRYKYIYIYMFVLFGVSTEGFTLNMVLPGYAPRIIDVGPYMQAHVVRCCFMIRPCLA